ncbi:hypothetical protein CLRAG_24260 [Clostridium ragsdalei P11]|uniref:Putative zinc-ribbon domain-containing protein n=1 Tax=Clostridium ragsdalei P11 TaxID=1353534 RepID=A0A1A6AR66_9CLOT|nr:zinc ribbon domain-containing protein [Clostridium ragsdalei]OBR92576.1 hypothetical protein CLRAG_24260 [Clostridium ragsdalei P11]
MAYCSKCGKKLEKGDIYCPDCGTKNIELKDNVKIRSQTVPNRNIDYKIIINIIVGMFLKPITTAKKFINETEKNIVVVLTLLFIAFQGFLGIWRANQIVSSISNVVQDVIRKTAEIVNLIQPQGSSNIINSSEMNEITGEISKIKSFIKIPYGEIFLQNCALVLISVLIIFVIICVANTLLSKKAPEKFKYYKTALIVTAPALYFEFFSIIFSYLSIDLGLATALFGYIFSLICFAMVINESLVISKNNTVFVVSFASLVTIIALILCFGWFMPSVLSSIVSSTMNDIKNLGI